MCLFFVVTLTILLRPVTPLAADETPRPNIIYIMVDDLGYGDLGCFGQQVIQTPNIDRLAKRGVLFTNAHCSAPSCNPSRVSMMTGVSPSTSGVYNNGQDWRNSPALATAVTIPDHLRAKGYSAYGGGKIFHSLSWIVNGYGKQQNEAKLWDYYFPEATKPLPPSLWHGPIVHVRVVQFVTHR